MKEHERPEGFDLEAAEEYVRSGMHRCGAMILSRLLAVDSRSALSGACPCGGSWRSVKTRAKTVRTILGDVRIQRHIQQCSGCGSRRAAEDELLDVRKTGLSPGLRRMMARTGEEMSFEKSADLLWELAHVRVNAKDVERCAEGVGAHIHAMSEDRRREVFGSGESAAYKGKAPGMLYVAMDGTGVPVVKCETQGRQGKGPEGEARTREAKIGAVFTQTNCDEKGEPVRDPGSTTYIGRIESVETFGDRLFTEALERGLHEAGRVAVMGDGAPWIWNLADLHFPGAFQIVDYYHAAEHLEDLGKALFADADERKTWCASMKEHLWEGEIERLVEETKKLRLRGAKKQARDREANYFEKNKERMRYAAFRSMGMFIGSGVVEAGCRTLVGERLKRSGMHWTVRGANAILALRCCVASGRFEDYWDQRRAA